MAAKQFVAAGRLGRVFKVEQERNSTRPYWHRYGQRTIQEADTDWKAFLMHRRARDWDPDQYLAWYGYREFSRGPHTNLMVHFIDLVHHITGAGPPTRAVTLGGTYVFKDSRTAPDSVETILDYPDAGFLVRYSTAFGTSAGNYLKFFGAKGVLDATNWSGKPFPISGEGSADPDRIAAGAAIPEVPSDPHMLNWLKCLRSRQQPNAPIEAGYSHGVAVILADEALVRGRRMIYDSARRAIREG
jgi:predicted dehydrogenase